MAEPPRTASGCDPEPRPWLRREPERTLLHRSVRNELETFLASARARGEPVPRFVEREIRAYLACGVLACGFLRLRCGACGHDRLVAFSCRGRGFCPSCGGRRMADTAAHIALRVWPHAPARQWVLTLPYALRYRCAYAPRLTTAVLRCFLRAVFRSLRRRARKRFGVERGETGAITFLQRFGSDLRLNLHFHSLVLDGVFETRGGLFETRDRLFETRDGAPPRFHPLPPPDADDVSRVLRDVARRVQRLLEREGADDPERLSRDEPVLAALAAASVVGRVASGSQAGVRWARLGDRVEPADDGDPDETAPCARSGGLSLHAGVAVPARDRQRLERLVRYVARPPLATERLEALPDGRLSYRLKQPWRDGTTHTVMTPAQLLERLVPLIPPPRAHQVRYHGCLAPCASWRDRIVPAGNDAGPEPSPAPRGLRSDREEPLRRGTASGERRREGATAAARCDRPERAHSLPAGALPGRASAPTEASASGETAPTRHETPSRLPRRMPWAALLRRVFAVDALRCPRCGEAMRLLAAIEDPRIAEAILACLDLPARAPPLAEVDPSANHSLGIELDQAEPTSGPDFDQSPRWEEPEAGE